MTNQEFQELVEINKKLGGKYDAIVDQLAEDLEINTNFETTELQISSGGEFIKISKSDISSNLLSSAKSNLIAGKNDVIEVFLRLKKYYPGEEVLKKWLKKYVQSILGINIFTNQQQIMICIDGGNLSSANYDFEAIAIIHSNFQIDLNIKTPWTIQTTKKTETISFNFLGDFDEYKIQIKSPDGSLIYNSKIKDLALGMLGNPGERNFSLGKASVGTTEGKYEAILILSNKVNNTKEILTKEFSVEKGTSVTCVFSAFRKAKNSNDGSLKVLLSPIDFKIGSVRLLKQNGEVVINSTTLKNDSTSIGMGIPAGDYIIEAIGHDGFSEVPEWIFKKEIRKEVKLQSISISIKQPEFNNLKIELTSSHHIQKVILIKDEDVIIDQFEVNKDIFQKDLAQLKNGTYKLKIIELGPFNEKIEKFSDSFSIYHKTQIVFIKVETTDLLEDQLVDNLPNKEVILFNNISFSPNTISLRNAKGEKVKTVNGDIIHDEGKLHTNQNVSLAVDIPMGEYFISLNGKNGGDEIIKSVTFKSSINSIFYHITISNEMNFFSENEHVNKFVENASSWIEKWSTGVTVGANSINGVNTIDLSFDWDSFLNYLSAIDARINLAIQSLRLSNELVSVWNHESKFKKATTLNALVLVASSYYKDLAKDWIKNINSWKTSDILKIAPSNLLLAEIPSFIDDFFKKEMPDPRDIWSEILLKIINQSSEDTILDTNSVAGVVFIEFLLSREGELTKTQGPYLDDTKQGAQLLDMLQNINPSSSDKEQLNEEKITNISGLKIGIGVYFGAVGKAAYDLEFQFGKDINFELFYHNKKFISDDLIEEIMKICSKISLSEVTA